jgi:carbonic anhydrase/acetyltransferase-like protein (isoleucine patch superfamily)
VAVFSLGEHTPQIHETAWVAPTASVIGNVILEEGASVWFGAVIRGDNEPITICKNANVQDNAVCHSDPGSPLTIGENATVGHLAMLHGCTIGANSLVGIGATVLNGAVIGEHCLVGAHSLVTEKKVFEDGKMVLGSPAKAVKSLPEHQQAMLRMSGDYYVKNSARFRDGMKAV